MVLRANTRRPFAHCSVASTQTHFFVSCFNTTRCSDPLRHQNPLHSSSSVLVSTLFVSFRHQRYARPTHAEITVALNSLKCSITDVGDQKEFKKKYLALVRQHHPDRGGSEEVMKNLTTAFDLLTSLSDSERREYLQRQKYGATSGPSGPTSKPYKSAAYQRQTTQTQTAYEFQDMYRRHYEETGSASSTSANYNTYKGQTATNDPFKFWRGGMYTAGTGSYDRTFHQMGRQAPSAIFFRAMFVYGVLVMLFIGYQRMRDDYHNEHGWATANVNARNDRLQQIYDARSDFLDRLKNREVIARMERERENERRVFDYASRRQQELNRMEFQSFPPLPTDGSMGTVFKVPADPVGILYFEPPMGNTFEAQMRKEHLHSTDRGPVSTSGGSGKRPPMYQAPNNPQNPMLAQHQQQQQQQQQNQYNPGVINRPAALRSSQPTPYPAPGTIQPPSQQQQNATSVVNGPLSPEVAAAVSQGATNGSPSNLQQSQFHMPMTGPNPPQFASHHK